jgi:hypothetical protein
MNTIPAKNLTVRHTRVLSLSELASGLDEPESVTIRSDAEFRNAPLDFGAFAYSIREKNLPTNPSNMRSIKVDLESFIAHRRHVLMTLFDHIFCKKMSSTTLISFHHKTRNLFNTLDSEGLSDSFLNTETAKGAYRRYSDLLSSQIDSGLIAGTTGSTRQNFFKSMILDCFGEEGKYVIQGVNSIASKRGHHRVPESGEVSVFAERVYTAASVLTKFVLEEQKFPFLLEAKGFRKYIFPFYYSVKAHSPRLPDTVNRDTGELNSIEAIKVQFPNTSHKDVNDCLRRANEHLVKSNSDGRCESRLRMAAIAATAYTLILQLITGISPAELCEVKYDDVVDSENGSVRAEFRSIKRRARGKSTRYVIGNKLGRRILIDYLSLRSWILNGNQCEYLFFRLRRKGSYTSKFGKLHAGFGCNAIDRIRKLFDGEEISYIGASLARKYKSLTLHERKISTKLISSMLNHSAPVNAVSYTETTEEKAGFELQNYWQQIKLYAANLIEQGSASNEAKPISSAAGGCKQFNSPRVLAESASIHPDCVQQFGCLYCENYVFHADAEDLHKLLSLKYVAVEIRTYASDRQFSDNLLRDLCIRIDAIIQRASQLSHHHSELVSEIKKRVFELGHLTDFWEYRLARLEMNGQVI